MSCYTATVATGNELYAGTNARIYLTLIGTENCSERTLLDKFFHIDFQRGAVDSYSIKVAKDLGDIVLAKLENKRYKLADAWYCRNLVVKSPSGEAWEFPCYRWLGDEQEVVLREGRAKLPQDDKTSLLKEHRCKELHAMKTLFRWYEWQPGFPLSISAKAYRKLPFDVQFSDQKTYDFTTNQLQVFQNMKINYILNVVSSWDNFDDFKKLFLKISNKGSEYVMQHWQEDFLFAYQFLNGCNPVMIHKCTQIPAKFPVTHEMVGFCLERGLTLEEEVKAGNIYIVDYEIMENITPNGTDPSTTCCLAAPICLLYRNTKNEILPIAIQLGQSPGENCPIFLPNDGEFDWMLAKIWVRSSDFHVHQTNTHLLGTHLITEVFAIAMYRQLAAVHPVYKLLIPHIRFTIAINAQARESLVGPGGIFDKIMAIGGGGHVELVQKAKKTFTYQSLVFPEAIKARGMDSQEDLPYYFYRDDGYKVWEAIRSFVEEIVHIYYKSDEVVVEDEEIQAFVKDVCSSGMRDQDHCGFPKSLKNREQLIEYLTAIIFNSSAQHAAVNFGQFEWSSWVPNAPSNMRKPPPTKKGVANLKYIMESLPNRSKSSQHMGVVWALSQYQADELYLGMYPDEHFTEKPVVEAMKKFRKNLADLSAFIKTRNEGKMMPYRYMSPDRIPNSVAV